MVQADRPGQIIIFDGIWMNIGVDRFMQMTPERCCQELGLGPVGNALTLSRSL